MIQSIINTREYNFKGTLDDLKKCLNSFRITKVLAMGTVNGITMCDIEGTFKYHGMIYKIYVNKIWTEDVLIIKYRGECRDGRPNYETISRHC